jgi:hypothetical protein
MQYLNHEYVLKLSYRDTAETETEVAEKSSCGASQTEGKNLVWFGEIKRKLAKSSMTTFAYRSSS